MKELGNIEIKKTELNSKRVNRDDMREVDSIRISSVHEDLNMIMRVYLYALNSSQVIELTRNNIYSMLVMNIVT